MGSARRGTTIRREKKAMSDTTGTDSGQEASEPADKTDKTAGSDSDKDVDFKSKYEETLTETRKWEKRAKDDFEDAKAWREYQESKKTDDEKREAREKELEQRAIKAETKALRADVADTKKVPVEWREFLTGATQEELEASADKIMTLIADKKGTTPDPNQGQPTGTPSGDFLRNAARH